MTNMKHSPYLLVAVALLLSVVAIGCAQQQTVPTPAAQTCDKVYDFQCLDSYHACTSKFLHIRSAEIRCEGAMDAFPVAYCGISAGYDQAIYNSPETKDSPIYCTQAQLDACKR
ncbi:MAG: hypothetical protein JWO19_4703 [Bryobacterales bacterium]|nr:hypothetical protein [Bryobacterales bacterium]